jgi:hypothetical protein
MNDPRAIVAPQDLTIEEVGEKHEAVITALADLIWPVIRERIKSTIDASIEAKIGNDLDDKINQSVESYINYSYDIDQQISNYLSSQFDLRDYDINDIVQDYMNDRLEDMVYESVSGLSFEVNVSR